MGPDAPLPDNEEVDFAIVGTGAGGGTLACKLAEAGFSVVAFDAGPFWRPLEDFVSDERWQGGLYWTDERITGGADPVELGSNNSGRGVGGSTVHYTMIALRWRPEWFKCKSTLGYGRDWPISFDELEPYYEEAEEALKISGPLQLSVGQAAQALSLPRASGERARAGARSRLRSDRDQMVADPAGDACRRRAAWRIPASIAASAPTAARPTPSRACSSPSFPARLKAGAEIRDLAMVGKIEMGKDGRATGLTIIASGEWRYQKARNVVVAGYAIETPRLLLNSECSQFPDGLANENGLVGTHIMIHSGPGVWGMMDEEVRQYKAPPCMAVTEHWNYDDSDKQGLPRRLCLHEPGPAAGRLGAGDVGPARAVGHGAARGDDPLQPCRGPADRRRDGAAAAQPHRARRREGPVRPADPAHDLLLFRQRPQADRAFDRIDAFGARGRRRQGAVGSTTTPRT